MDYNTLVADITTAGSIKNWVNDPSIDPVTILGEAQAHIYTKLRVQEMITSTSSFAAGINVESVAAPSGCLDIVNMRWLTPDLIILEKVIIDELDNKRLYNTDGTLVQDLPRWYALAGDNIAFCVRNDVARVAYLRYYKRPDDLSGVNTTNFLTTKFPRLLRCFCLGYANEFKKDEVESESWLQKGAAQLSDYAQYMDDLRQRGFKQMPTAD